MRGVLNGDEGTLREYWRESRELREMDPLELDLRRIRNILEAVEAHARFAAEMARLHAEDRAAVLEARDKLTLLRAPKPGPRSNFAGDVELARQCYEATHSPRRKAGGCFGNACSQGRDRPVGRLPALDRPRRPL
jgi:hypothetical protein